MGFQKGFPAGVTPEVTPKIREGIDMVKTGPCRKGRRNSILDHMGSKRVNGRWIDWVNSGTTV